MLVANPKIDSPVKLDLRLAGIPWHCFLSRPATGTPFNRVISENHPIEPPRDVFTYTSFPPRCISILTPPPLLN
jgi:hypothetical protein